ncbi:MAG TPA: phosphoglycerate kinase, partial [Gammaproteobacteria bacterium]|nr:phosphoglycerate kinase [Gammaproteobacteria bacterium]
MAQFLTINDVNINKKRVLIREDFNVPIADGVVQNDLRIRAALPGIQQALRANAQVILMSHLGRPEPGHWQAEFSLQPIAACLSEMLNENVKFIKQWPVDNLNVHDKIVLLENVRFLPGETENSPDLAKQMAALCDVFVMDAFGSAHRAHASTVGVAEFSA